MPGGFKGKEKHSTLSVRSKKCLLPHIKTNNKNKCQLFDVCGYFYSSEYLQLFKENQETGSDMLPVYKKTESGNEKNIYL